MRGWQLGLVVTLMAGCGDDALYKELDQTRHERDDLQAEVADLKERLDVAKGHIKELEKAASRATDVAPLRPDDNKVLATRSQLKLTPGQSLQAKLTTSMGDISCELFPDIAPETVLNFVGLAEGTKEWTDPRTHKKTIDPLYNGTIFHRVIDGFMIQGGDPLGLGTGGPGYAFGDEIWPDVRFDRPGRLAMANSGPNTNGSQFFITSKPTPHLNGRHTIFGQCDTEVVEKIMRSPLSDTQTSRPVTDVVLKKVEISRVAPKTAASAPAPTRLPAGPAAPLPPEPSGPAAPESAPSATP